MFTDARPRWHSRIDPSLSKLTRDSFDPKLTAQRARDEAQRPVHATQRQVGTHSDSVPGGILWSVRSMQRFSVYKLLSNARTNIRHPESFDHITHLLQYPSCLELRRVELDQCLQAWLGSSKSKINPKICVRNLFKSSG